MERVTRGEQLAAEIRRGCEHAADEADTLAVREGAYRADASALNLHELKKQRKRLSHALLALNGPIRSYQEMLHPEVKLTLPLRLVRWIADLGARGATFRGRS